MTDVSPPAVAASPPSFGGVTEVSGPGVRGDRHFLAAPLGGWLSERTQGGRRRLQPRVLDDLRAAIPSRPRRDVPKEEDDPRGRRQTALLPDPIKKEVTAAGARDGGRAGGRRRRSGSGSDRPCIRPLHAEGDPDRTRSPERGMRGTRCVQVRRPRSFFEKPQRLPLSTLAGAGATHVPEQRVSCDDCDNTCRKQRAGGRPAGRRRSRRLVRPRSGRLRGRSELQWSSTASTEGQNPTHAPYNTH